MHASELYFFSFEYQDADSIVLGYPLDSHRAPLAPRVCVLIISLRTWFIDRTSRTVPMHCPYKPSIHCKTVPGYSLFLVHFASNKIIQEPEEVRFVLPVPIRAKTFVIPIYTTLHHLYALMHRDLLL